MKKAPVIIPARAGSKGIIGKNVIDFCGKPLISWSILQAQKCDMVSSVYVSTDGDEIADTAVKYGAKVVKRPAQLASDTASSEEAILHAVKEIEQYEDFDTVIFLQATSPIRRDFDIQAALNQFYTEKCDSLFSMTVLDDYCLWRKENGKVCSFTYDYKNRGRRQEREDFYLENGSIYVFSKQLFLKEHNRLGGRIGMYEMPMACSYEIDTTKDIQLCEHFMKLIVLDAEKNESMKQA